MDLNEDDVIQIIKYLDESNFNELRLQLGRPSDSGQQDWAPDPHSRG